MTTKPTELERDAANVILKTFNDDPSTAAMAARQDRSDIADTLAQVIHRHNAPLYKRIKTLESGLA